VPYSLRTDRVNPTKKTYLFAVRSPDRRVHDRLVAAAAHDGVSVAEMINRLLDLREQWEELTCAPHPLGRPAAVPVKVPLRLVPVHERSELRAQGATLLQIDGRDYFYGPASAHDPGYYARHLESMAAAATTTKEIV
jgi:hypothetical protein